MKVLLLLTLISVVLSQTLLKSFDFKHPSFVSVTGSDTDPNKSLFISQFGIFAKGQLFIQSGLNNLEKSTFNFNPTGLSTESTGNTPFIWPNQVTFMPPLDGVAPYGGVLVPTGFLVPGSGNGGVYLYAFTNETRSAVYDEAIQLIPHDQDDWFYHRIIPYTGLTGPDSVNLVTCRARKPLIGGWKGELVFLTLNNNYTWDYDVIGEGCDVFFRIADLDNDGRIEIVSTAFFTFKLVLFWTEDPQGNWLNSAKSRIIDENGGAFFDVEIDDLNGDGKIEALITNHQKSSDSIPPQMYVYQIPAKPKTDAWVRRVVADGYQLQPSSNPFIAPTQGPGSPLLFRPKYNDTTSNPWVVLAGDGTFNAYIYEPIDNNFTYKLVFNQTFDGTVGGIAVDDINHDGWTDILIPAYDTGYISIYTFRP